MKAVRSAPPRSSSEAPSLYVVRRERGGPWDWSRDLREQEGFDEHAAFMDGLVESGFVLLGGPLEGDREALLIVDAPSEEAIRERLAQDNWTANSMLTVTSIERWTILLDAVALYRAGTS